MEEFELESGEVVVRSVRQHLFVLALQFLPLVVLFFLPALASSFLSLFSSMNPATGAAIANINLPPNVVNFFTGLFYLGLVTAAFSLFTRYYLTVWVITNLRIVDIKQKGFFNRHVSSFLLIRVQDLTTEVSGLLGTLIGFGKLSVQTAGQDDDFSMDGIAHPAYVRDVIMSQVSALHPPHAPASGI